MQLIVNSQSEFETDYELYKEWHNKLPDVAYMLLVGKYKGELFEGQEAQIKQLVFN